MKPRKNDPFYRQLIAYARNGFINLDEESQAEVKRFILEQKSENGGFRDRAGIPDVYYSLFGFFLSEAAGLQETKPGLMAYIGHLPATHKKGLINRCCIAIIGMGLKISARQRISGICGLIREFFSGAVDMSRQYHYFMAFLVLDAYGLNNPVSRFLIRPLFKKQEFQSDIPCPVAAAIVVLKTNLGLPADKELSLLMGFFDEENGFKSFKDAPAADMLSTAVALAALKSTGCDLRLVRPACLNLVERNFDSGAFLAGNGDWEHDTEYTFYGLLALGLIT